MTTALETARFRAVAGNRQAFGATPRDALDALTAQLPPDATFPIAILPFNQGDALFTQAQHDRLLELKSRQAGLPPAEIQELDVLIEAEFDASVARLQNLQQVK